MPANNDHPIFRSACLPDGAPLDYAPDNEQGVVYLFSHLARSRFGLRVERVQGGFPDCVAYLGSKRVRIEFEYRSRNFAVHRHDPKQCDWVVCWIHDWPAAPRNLRIVELRREFGLGFNVWLQPVGADYRDYLAEIDRSPRWSVPSQATEGDLLLVHRTSPDSHIRDVFRMDGPVRQVVARWKEGKDWMGPIRRVCTLKAPLHFSQLQAHKVLANAGFVRGQMRKRYRATEYWPELYHMVVARNPAVAGSLGPYGPARIA